MKFSSNNTGWFENDIHENKNQYNLKIIVDTRLIYNFQLYLHTIWVHIHIGILIYPMTRYAYFDCRKKKQIIFL